MRAAIPSMYDELFWGSFGDDDADDDGDCDDDDCDDDDGDDDRW